MAKATIKPHVAEFITRLCLAEGVEIGEFIVKSGSSMIGKTLKELNLRKKLELQ
ncbi:MAG: TrkA C-terminal domain-containing protein [Euryarchaeota archaeon]|nr:TrkA C-terminal domain-containing protein [Euryarchaeota archaeon]